jgi:hypothetical protein
MKSQGGGIEAHIIQLCKKLQIKNICRWDSDDAVLKYVELTLYFTAEIQMLENILNTCNTIKSRKRNDKYWWK